MQDFTGRVFGRLTVVGAAARRGYVRCVCSCGSEKDIRKTSLTKGRQPTRSCGCIQREFASNHGARSIEQNSSTQIKKNMQYGTNFQVIENPALPRNNTSGCKGVSWCASRKLYEAYINVHGQRISLGRRASFDDAVALRKRGGEGISSPVDSF